MDTLYTFWDNITHYRTESVHFWGLINSATKFRVRGLNVGLGFRLYGSGDIGVQHRGVVVL